MARKVFCLVSLSSHPTCKLCSPKPKMQVKPKDASLAPPSGKTEVSVGVASGPLLGAEKKLLGGEKHSTRTLPKKPIQLRAFHFVPLWNMLSLLLFSH